MVHAYHERIVVEGEEVDIDILVGHVERQVAVGEIGMHLLAGHLIVVERVDALYRQGLVDDVNAIERGIVGPGLDDLAQQLLSLLPDDGVLVHRQAGIAPVVNQGIAHALHVDTVGTHVVIGMHDAID